MALTAVVMMAQTPVITFDELRHDFGTIYKEDGNVTHEFWFTNEGNDAVIITNAKAGCGCTTSKKTETPIEPGQRGFVSATYRAASQRPGHFDKYVNVTFSSSTSQETKQIKLTFFGDLKEKPATPESAFTIHVGSMAVKTRDLELGSVRKGEVRVDGLEFANLDQAAHNVTIYLGTAASFIEPAVSVETIQPNEIAKFSFSLNTNVTKLWGPQTIPAYIVIDGKRDMSDEYRILLHFNITPDFSQLTVEEKQNAPIIEIEDKVEMGSVEAGKNMKFVLPVKNTGVNALEILRVYSNGEELTVKAPKAIKSGKKGAITIDINAKELKPGTYTSDLNIISNDYQHAIKRIKVSWTVE